LDTNGNTLVDLALRKLGWTFLTVEKAGDKLSIAIQNNMKGGSYIMKQVEFNRMFVFNAPPVELVM